MNKLDSVFIKEPSSILVDDVAEYKLDRHVPTSTMLSSS